MPVTQLGDRVGEWTGSSGLQIFEPAASACDGLTAVHAFEELLVRRGVLDDMKREGPFQP
jgi:hypothetical protein